MNRNFILIFVFAVALIGIPITIYLVSQQQDVRSRAQSTPPACTTPAAVKNVRITYPNCDGTNCSLDSASCTWDANTDASTYKVHIVEDSSGSIVKDDSVPSSTLKVVFPVTNGKSYTCQISAVNSCGTAGPPGSDTQICQVANPTVPTSTPVATPTTFIPTPTSIVLIPTSTPFVFQPTVPVSTPLPQPTMVPAGSISSTITFGIGGLAIVIIGGMLLLF